MRTLHFGEAMTEIPDDWRSKVDPRGVTMAAPPNQTIAFLWMSTISWETPDQSGSNPADDFFSRADSPQPVKTEDRDDFVIAYFIDADPKFETHTFRVLPKKAFQTRCASAILTLSIKAGSRSLPIAHHAVHETWEIARKVRFNDASKA